MTKRICKLLSCAAVACAISGIAAAQQAPQNSSELDEVVVTATKSGETKLQQTPLAISAFSGDQLGQSMATNVKDLAYSVPNLNISQTTSFAEIYIRGVGSNNTGNGSDPDVTVQVDGIYQARPFTQFTDFLDVDRVEVLRGPQGTLYGRNAVGGTINVVSRQPSDTFRAEEQLTLGNYGEVQEQAYVSGPIIPGTLQFSVATDYERHDDYLTNIAPGGNNVFGQNEGGIRAQLRWVVDNGFDATTRIDFHIASYDLENFDEITEPLPPSLVAQGALNNTIYGNYSKVALNSPQYANVGSGGVAEEVNYVFNDALSLKSLSAYRKATNYGHIDSDYTNLNAANVFQGEDEDQFTQEFNLIGRYSAADFVTGVFYLHENDQSSTYVARPEIDLKIGIPPLTHTDSEAVFAQGTFHVTDDFSLIAGGRYTMEQKQMYQNYNYMNLTTGDPIGKPASIFDLDRDYSAFTPKGGITWRALQNLMFYASVTKGYKSGGYNYVASTPAAAAFSPEKLLSYEAGEKSDWLDHRLRLNLTGFIYHYQDLQVNQLISPGVVSISNAADASVKGVEFELTAVPVEGLKLTANLSKLDARYSNYPNAPLAAALGTGTIDATGHYLDAAPPYSAFLAAQYDWHVGIGNAYFRSEYAWEDRVFYDPSNFWTQSQGAYGLLNLDTGYKWDDGWQAQLWGKNVTNKEYLFGAAANGLVPTGEVGAPRTYGIRVTKNW
jgi:iron complex outermembrane receptor protein